MKQYIFFTLLIIWLFASCKKDKSSTADEVTHKVKTATTNAGYVSTFEYDNQGRITRLSGSDHSKQEYLYTAGVVQENMYDANGILKYAVKYELNADGLATRQTYIPQEPGETIYTYNASRQPLSITSNNGNGSSTEIKYHYSGTQLDSIRTYTATGGIRQKMIYEYYPDIKNTTTEQHCGFLFWGKQSPAAVKKETSLFYDATVNLDFTEINNYTYEVDAQKRITRVVINGTISSGNTTYTYY